MKTQKIKLSQVKPVVINVKDLPIDLQKQVEEMGIGIGRSFTNNTDLISHRDMLKEIDNDSYVNSEAYKHLGELAKSTDLILGKNSARKKHYDSINPRNSKYSKKYNGRDK